MMKPKLKSIVTALVFVLLFSVFASAVPVTVGAAAPDDSNAESIFAYCINNGITLYDKNSDISFSPSDLTKMMTGLIACEMLSDSLEKQITITPQMLAGASGDTMGIVVDETMPVKDLIYGLICCGYNDCATALAVYISGSSDNFVRLMNSRAAELGMNATLYTSPTGSEKLTAKTTARDIAMLSEECTKNQLYLSISSTAKHKLSPTNKSDAVNIYSKNHLISQYKEPKYYNPDCKGLFAGSTGDSKHGVSTVAADGDMSYIIVVANAKVTKDNIYSYTTVTDLLDWVCDQYDYVDIIKEGSTICTLPVTMSDVIKETDIYAERPVSMIIPAEDKDKIKTSLRLNYSSLKAPVSEGQQVGYITVTYGNQTETVRLVASESIEGSKFLYTIDSISNLFQSRVFKATVASIFVLSVIALLVDYKIKRKSSGYNYLRRK